MYSDKYVLKLFLGLIFLQIFVKFLKKLLKKADQLNQTPMAYPQLKQQH